MKKIQKPYLIAEIGINHNGSIDLAKKLILLAKKYDFDCVKFQKRDLNICIPEHQKNIFRDTPWGYISYFDYKKKIEFTINDYKKIDKFCKKVRINWFASSWDINSQKEMRLFRFKYNKIASAMITNLPFLELVAKEKKKTFISTGMCNIKIVEKAVKIFKKHKCPFVLLHCVSTYPCPEDQLNLNLIKTYKKKFKCDVGYSGHESTVSPSIVALMMGAKVIERHITLDRSMWGTDQSASLQGEGLKNLTSIIRKIPSFLGDGVKRFGEEEKKISKKFRYWE
ncbi:N-acetylneuraminate synthase family protein [Pelagibacterales bacterium SAG-MED09]|nr:N-acetylneuraminate synthase family protein [Pelagibacterales bacterium SAG-MED09]